MDTSKADIGIVASNLLFKKVIKFLFTSLVVIIENKQRLDVINDAMYLSSDLMLYCNIGSLRQAEMELLI